MAGNFGGLLKICHLAEFTLAVEPVFSHSDIHNKMANQTCWEFTGFRLSYNKIDYEMQLKT